MRFFFLPGGFSVVLGFSVALLTYGPFCGNTFRVEPVAVRNLTREVVTVLVFPVAVRMVCLEACLPVHFRGASPVEGGLVLATYGPRCGNTFLVCPVAVLTLCVVALRPVNLRGESPREGGVVLAT